MGDVIDFSSKKNSLKKELEETREALKIMHDSLKEMYSMTEQVELRTIEVEDYYSQAIEEYGATIGIENIESHLMEFYSPIITEGQLNLLIKHPDFPEVLKDPAAVMKFLEMTE